MKKTIKKSLAKLGYELRNLEADRYSREVIELGPEVMSFVDYVESESLTMASRFRLIATAMAVKHVVHHGIKGDFVECGVYRGGNAILAAKILDLYGEKRSVWLFDTFNGMTEPTEADKGIFSKRMAKDKWRETLDGEQSSWCLASLEEVKMNVSRAGLNFEQFRFVEGDVLSTLSPPPAELHQIAVLRLDTDWYESTRKELQSLYPRLERGGVLLIDDYGHWEGAKRAVDEYFGPDRPFMSAVDYTGRTLVKP